MDGSSRGSFGCGPFLLVAALSAVAAVAAWFVPGQQSSLRVTAFDVVAFRASLLERAEAFGDAAARGLAGDSDESFRLRLTGQRAKTVSGPEWEAVFATLASATGRWRSDLPSDFRPRVSAEDESHVTAVFFRPDEAPFSALRLPPGETAYLERDPGRPEMLEVLHVPAGVREGEVTTSRFFKSRWTLPVSLAWPLRRFSAGLAAVAVLALVAGYLLRAALPSGEAPPAFPQGAPAVNPRRRTGLRALAVAGALVATCFVPALVKLDGMKGGFALILVAGFGAFAALLTALILLASARRLDRLLRGEALFARWVYPPEQWRRFVEAEHGVESAEKRALFLFVAGIVVVVTALFVLAVRDVAALQVAAGMLVLVGVLWLVVTVGPGARHRRLLRAAPEVWIGPEGILAGETYHDFAMAFGRIDAVRLRDVEGTLLLEVDASYPSRTGRSTATARVPVPGDDPTEGLRVAGMYGREVERVASGSVSG